MSTVDEIKARIDIVDLVSESGVKLRRSGRNHTGFCPFHNNTRTPAFVVCRKQAHGNASANAMTGATFSNS